MIKFSIRKLTLLFVLALAVVCANAAIFYGNTIDLIHSQKAVTSSHRVIAQIENFLSHFQDIEIAQRNYLITANINDFQTYVAAKQSTNKSLDKLRNLTTNSAHKKQWFLLLKQKVNQRLDILQTEVEVRKEKGWSEVAQLVKSQQPQQKSQQIQTWLENYLTESQDLLQQKVERSQANFNKTMTMFFIATVVNIALVALLYQLLRGYIVRLKRTELALRQSENRLRAMIDAEPECIKLIAKDGTLLEINAFGVEIMEVESGDILVGKPIDTAILPEYRPAFASLHQRVCQGYKGNLEFEIVGFKGTRRWMESHSVPLRNEVDGEFLHLSVTRDITQQKLAEQKIREQAALLDIAVDAILVQDIDGTILFWNQGAANIYRWQSQEALGKKACQLLYKETSTQWEDVTSKVMGRGSWLGELSQITKDGKEIIVESRWTLVRDDNGNPKSMLIVNTEITQKKQLEIQLLRSQRLESIGTLAGGIAHDLNNVLSPILMSVQMLRMKLPQQQHQQLLQMLENNVKRGASLVQQVLSFARGVEGKRTPVQVQQLLAEIEQIITRTFPKSIICHTDVQADLWMISGDPTQIHQVLMNLVVNARDAMPDGGYLRIYAENRVIDEQYSQINIDAKPGNYIVITVEDTGIGIPSAIQERIFEPFFTTKTVGEGTGLGLSTALGIIKNYGGFVNMHSQEDKGTQFQVYLPSLTNGENDPPCRAIIPLKGRGELILVVDDEAVIREITRSSLEQHNYRVLTAKDGVEAVSIYAKKQQEISLVLLDMLMPHLDGTIAIRTLQKINPHVKIIAISGLMGDRKIAEVQDMGVKAILSKPCTAQELLRTINTVNYGNG
ncbi:MAG: PAS domain S-box protein [Calothrix sp. MO_192.B10]|nr:PAS domain S-box protein [Calothrix sp. MO_192.B10]